MTRFPDAAAMTAEERLRELASILARGYRRLQLASETQAASRPSYPHTPQERHHHADRPLST